MINSFVSALPFAFTIGNYHQSRNPKRSDGLVLGFRSSGPANTFCAIINQLGGDFLFGGLSFLNDKLGK